MHREYTLCICELAYQLTFICNLQTKSHSTLQSYKDARRMEKKWGCSQLRLNEATHCAFWSQLTL